MYDNIRKRSVDEVPWQAGSNTNLKILHLFEDNTRVLFPARRILTWISFIINIAIDDLLERTIFGWVYSRRAAMADCMQFIIKAKPSKYKIWGGIVYLYRWVSLGSLLFRYTASILRERGHNTFWNRACSAGAWYRWRINAEVSLIK